MALFTIAVPGGTQPIIRSIGFKARTLLIDNYTNTWYWIQEVDYYIPPKWVGVVIPLDHMTDYINIQPANPFKQFTISTGVQASQFQIHIKATDQVFEYVPGRAYQDLSNAGAVYQTQIAYDVSLANAALNLQTSPLTDIPIGQFMTLKVPRIRIWRTSTATISGTGELVLNFSKIFNGVLGFITVGNGIAAGDTQILWEYESDLRPLLTNVIVNERQTITLPAGGAGVKNHGYMEYEYWYAV